MAAMENLTERLDGSIVVLEPFGGDLCPMALEPAIRFEVAAGVHAEHARLATAPLLDQDPANRSLLRWESALVVLLLATIALGDHLSPAFMHSNNFFYLGLNVGEVAYSGCVVR